MARAWALVAVLGVAPVAAAEPRIVPLERALQGLSFGPTLSAEATRTRDGWGGVALVGLALAVYDLDAKTDPECEERRRKEREALGGEKVKPWGDVIKGVQQPCPSISESWWPRFESRFEIGPGAWASKGTVFRGSAGGYGWRWFLLGGTLSGVVADDAEGDSVFGLRAGPELSAHLRFGQKSVRPVLVLFARGELTLLRRDRFGDQVALGARFLFDL